MVARWPFAAPTNACGVQHPATRNVSGCAALFLCFKFSSFANYISCFHFPHFRSCPRRRLRSASVFSFLILFGSFNVPTLRSVCKPGYASSSRPAPPACVCAFCRCTAHSVAFVLRNNKGGVGRARDPHERIHIDTQIYEMNVFKLCDGVSSEQRGYETSWRRNLGKSQCFCC